MNTREVRVSPHWLRLREPVDAAARSPGLAGFLRREAVGGRVRVVHDLGCGDGAMGRWLGSRLEGPQHWVLHDRDPRLLDLAASDPPTPAPGMPRVSVQTRLGDITRLRPDDLADASLVTASALLDMLTGEELGRLVRSCVGSAAPVLITLSVTGRVRLTPADPFDAWLREAFNDHQRRTTGRGDLLGPDAVRFAVGLFHDLGHRVRVRPSPWRLDAGCQPLTRQWLRGWVGAAVEHRPGLASHSELYLARRIRQLESGDLRVVVQHLDLLATPGGGAR